MILCLLCITRANYETKTCIMQVGNALTDDYHDHLGVFQFLWSAGFISDQTFKLLNLLCDFQSFVHTSNSCGEILEIASEELGNIDPYSVFTPPCSANISQSNQLLRRRHVSTHSICRILSVFLNSYKTFHSNISLHIIGLLTLRKS